jgi:hypothetical protein
MDGNIHRCPSSLEKRGEAIGFAIAVGVLDDNDPVVLEPLVTLGREMSVTLDDKQSAPMVEVHANGMNDIRRGGEWLDDQARIAGARHILHSGLFCLGIVCIRSRGQEEEAQNNEQGQYTHTDSAVHGWQETLGRQERYEETTKGTITEGILVSERKLLAIQG